MGSGIYKALYGCYLMFIDFCVQEIQEEVLLPCLLVARIVKSSSQVNFLVTHTEFSVLFFSLL